jgi:hypothetical protein
MAFGFPIPTRRSVRTRLKKLDTFLNVALVVTL